MEADSPLQSTQRMFSSLDNRDFRYLWFGNLAATFAMQMQMVARGWLIYDMTQSPIQLAWVMMAFSLPMILFSLFGGVAADRLTKKWLMIVAQSANCVSTFAIELLTLEQGDWSLLDPVRKREKFYRVVPPVAVGTD